MVLFMLEDQKIRSQPCDTYYTKLQIHISNTDTTTMQNNNLITQRTESIEHKNRTHELDKCRWHDNHQILGIP